MKLADILKEKGMSGMQLSQEARIAPGDFYQAMHGKRPFFPAWRKRICEVLGMEESEVFPEYIKKEE